MNKNENLRQIADHYAALSVLFAEQASCKEDSQDAQSETEERSINELSIEDVRTVLVKKSQSGHTQEVKALLSKFGVEKLSEIDPAKYSELLAEAEAL